MAYHRVSTRSDGLDGGYGPGSAQSVRGYLTAGSAEFGGLLRRLVCAVGGELGAVELEAAPTIGD